MEITFKYLKLYTINEVSLSSDFIEFETNKKYVIAVFKNNNLIRLFINYKFHTIDDKLYYIFNNTKYYCTFRINNYDDEIIILELIYDFTYKHYIDLLSTHYDKENINNIYIDMQRCQIYKLRCLSLIIK